MKLIGLAVSEERAPLVTPEPLSERWLTRVEHLCEECDCHTNAIMAASAWKQEFGAEEVYVVTGLVRARTERGWSFDHSWVRVGESHLDPTADFFWLGQPREEVDWIPVIERAQPESGLLPVRALAHALSDLLTSGGQ